jgi:hypothetical protein
MNTLADARTVAIGLAALAPWLACASARAPSSCTGAGSCGHGQSCLVGACRPANAEVVPLQTRRIVLPATQTVVVCSGAVTAVDASVIVLRSPTCGDAKILLRFEVPWGPDARVTAAFVVLGLSEDTPWLDARASLEASPILERWSSATLDLRLPATGVPTAAVLAGPSGVAARELRIEVTSTVSSWARRTLDDNGLAVTAAAGGESIALLASGAGDAGGGPRLDVYLR